MASQKITDVSLVVDSFAGGLFLRSTFGVDGEQVNSALLPANSEDVFLQEFWTNVFNRTGFISWWINTKGATTGGGFDFSSELESSEEFLTVEKSDGSDSAVIPGPNAVSNRSRDSVDPYSWTAVNGDLFDFLNGLGAGTHTVNLIFNDGQSNAPTIADQTVDAVEGTAGTATIAATGEPIPALTATGLSTGITFVDNGDGTGTLSYANSVADGTYAITVKATNTDGTATATITLVVRAVPDLGGNIVLDVSTGSAGSSTLKQITDGTPPITYSIVGMLPVGFSFNARTRVLSWNANTIAGNTNVRYKAANLVGSDDVRLRIRVTAVDVPVVLPGVEDMEFEQNVKVDITLPAATSGNAPIVYALAGGLPNGLSFNANNRKITGTPTTVDTGGVELTYAATDADNDTDSSKFTVTVIEEDTNPTLPVINDIVFDQAVGTRTIQLPKSPTGNSPIVYSLTPDLPSGSSFDANTRIITLSVVDVISETEYTYTAEDTHGDTAIRKFNISVNEPNTQPSLPLIGARKYSVGNDVVDQLPSSPTGNEPITYDLIGSLPSGLSFNGNTRRITGNPKSAFSKLTFQYKATDADGESATRNFTIEVVLVTRPTKIGTPPDIEVRIGEPIDVLLPSAYNGIPPFTYGLEVAYEDGLLGQLPKGVEFNKDTRQLKGVIDSEVDISATIMVTDVTGLDATAGFKIKATEAPPTGSGSYRSIQFRIMLKIYEAADGAGRGFNFWNGAGNLTIDSEIYEPGIVNSTDDLETLAQGRTTQGTVNVGADLNSQFRAFMVGDPGVRLVDLFLIHRFSSNDDWSITDGFTGARIGGVGFDQEYIAFEITNDLDSRSTQLPDEFSDEFQSANYNGDRFFMNLKRIAAGNVRVVW